MERLLIYSQDGMGLGHLRRTRNIASAILDKDPGRNILIVSDSPATPFFLPLDGIDYLKLPTIVKTGDVTWRPGTLPMGIDEAVQLRAKIIEQVFREFHPDAILVDHMPVGALGELKPMLDTRARMACPPHLYLGLRDVLDAPEVIRSVWLGLDAYEYLAHYDAALVYGCREFFDAESAYHLTPSVEKVLYCNYVGPMPTAHGLQTSMSQPFVLVMSGGGKDGYPVAKTFLDALPLILPKVPLHALILAGPNMATSQRDELTARAATYPVQVLASTTDAITLLQRASVVVTMAGYNSLCEILACRKKALVVPRSGPSSEQRIRSVMFAQKRLIRVVEANELTPHRFAEEFMRLWQDEDVPDVTRLPPMDGAQRAAEVLLGGAGFEPARRHDVVLSAVQKHV